MIPYGKHFLDDDDINAVLHVLKDGWLTQGPLISTFEKKVADYVGCKYAVAVSSLTAGLHISCIAANLSKEDSLVTSPMSFCASSNCALYVGANPAFADIDTETINIDPRKIDEECQRLGNVKVIIPVHYAGLPCKMDDIAKVAEKHKAIIIEDAAHALGARYTDGSMVGSCQHSLITGFSFHPVKSITSGEGGILCTNDEDIYSRLLRLRSHGINKGEDSLLNQREAHTGAELNPWYYEMQELGYHYRITDIQCALGISQLDKLDEFTKKRQEIARFYDSHFENMENLKPVHLHQREQSANHLYAVRINFDALKTTKLNFYKKLEEFGIKSQVHYIPIPMHPYYQKNLLIPKENYKQALTYYRETLSLPLFPSLTNKETETVISAIKKLVD